MSFPLIFHTIAFVNYIISISYDQLYVDIPMMSHEKDIKFFKGRLKFLTVWNMLLQALFFTICLLNDFIGSNEDDPKKMPLIRKVKDVLLSSLAFPISMFVGLTFWGLYFVDRELVFPKALDPYFPVWLNHVMHTNIMIFILIEMATSFRRYPARKVGITILLLFKALYLIWIHIIHAYSGMWVYPVLDVLNLPARIVFFISLLALSLALYLLGERLNNAIWKEKLGIKKKAKKAF